MSSWVKNFKLPSKKDSRSWYVLPWLLVLTLKCFFFTAQHCEALGGRLAEIIDEENQKAIEEFLDTVDPDGTRSFWIGLTDLFEEGNFMWTSGTEATYRNWLQNEPNNVGGDEHFVHIWTKMHHQRRWNDEENEKTGIFALCQFVLWSFSNWTIVYRESLFKCKILSKLE